MINYARRDDETYYEWLWRIIDEHKMVIRGNEKVTPNLLTQKTITTNLELYSALHAYQHCLAVYIEKEK